jgi:chaperonin GroEL
MRERLERTKDAVSAARAAADEGIVPGGGVAFIQISEVLKGENDGEKLLIEVLKSVTNKLLENAGEADPDQIVKSIKDQGGNFGYNVNTGKVEDMIKSGVIDPAKVIRLSLENAIAVAGSILSTDCLIVDEAEKVDTKMQVV